MCGLPSPRVGRAHNPQELVLVCIAREGTWERYWSLEGTQRPSSLGWPSVRSGRKGRRFLVSFFSFFFFFLMNILGRRRRRSQGDLVFHDLRSSVKQNKLSSFKVNDGQVGCVCCVGKEARAWPGSKPGRFGGGLMLSQQGVGAGSASCVFGLTYWSLGGGGHLFWEDGHFEGLPLCGAAARARRFLIFN